MKGRQGSDSRRSVEAGTEAENGKERCLLTDVSWFSQPAASYTKGHPPVRDTHSVQGPRTSIIK